MSAVEFPRGYHPNRYTTESDCKHCGGVTRHLYWCRLCNPAVGYAYDIVDEAERVSLQDQLILHALGVAWM